MDCFHDFCLFCDRDSPDGPYCSQRCKLSDLERANQSSPSSPISPTGPKRDDRWTSSPYKLSSHSRQDSTPGYDAPSTASSRPRSSYFMWNPSHRSPEDFEHQLTPSSSRTSLSSTISTSSIAAAGGMSPQARQQLQEYFSSFDQAKAAKRRSSLR